jgi:DNA-binding transcriptional LysR family regulator
VSLPAHSAVQVLLQRAAALKGRVVVHRVIVSNFEAALRVVRANLAISVVPREVAEPYARTYGLRVLPLTDDWAKRRFAICFRDEAAFRRRPGCWWRIWWGLQRRGLIGFAMESGAAYPCSKGWSHFLFNFSQTAKQGRRSPKTPRPKR